MPRFTLRTLIASTAGLMTYVCFLSTVPLAILVSLSIPAFCALLFLPYLSLRLLSVLTDPEERSFESEQLQNCLWTIFFCLVAFAPLISLISSQGYELLEGAIIRSYGR